MPISPSTAQQLVDFHRNSLEGWYAAPSPMDTRQRATAPAATTTAPAISGAASTPAPRTGLINSTPSTSTMASAISAPSSQRQATPQPTLPTAPATPRPTPVASALQSAATPSTPANNWTFGSGRTAQGAPAGSYQIFGDSRVYADGTVVRNQGGYVDPRTTAGITYGSDGRVISDNPGARNFGNETPVASTPAAATTPAASSPATPTAQARPTEYSASLLDINALDRRQVSDRETVSGQMNTLMDDNGRYLQAARERGMRAAAGRGLINSSIASSAGEEAAINAALGIATPDAATYGRAGDYNVTVANQGRLANMDAQNRFTSQRMDIDAADTRQIRGIDADRSIAELQSETQRYGVDRQADTSRYGTDVQAGTSRYVADTQADTSRYGTDTQAATSRYNTDTQADTSRYNTNVQAGTTRYATDAQERASRYSSDTSRDNAVLSADTQRYGTDVNAATSRYGTDTQAATSRYSTDSQASTQLSTAQLNSGTQRFVAELNNNTDRYRTDQAYRQQMDNTRLNLTNNVLMTTDLSPDRKAALLEQLGQGTPPRLNPDGSVTPGTGLAGAIYVIDSATADLVPQPATAPYLNSDLSGD